MKKVAEIDKNFKLETHLEEKKISFYNIKEKPFDIYGLYHPQKGRRFTRMNPEIARKVNEGVEALNYHTAGGRVRFRTDSPYVAISVRMPSIFRMAHMPLSGSSGFDLYLSNQQGYQYEASFIPPVESVNGFEAIHYFKDTEMKDITINFPLYNEVSEVYIGISKDSTLSSGGKYRNEFPVVYYGSSITQGGCASRPGNCYQAMLSRKFDLDYVNLGFSGSARGEQVMAEYLAEMDMSCFVYDYDHNAETVELLEQTHAPMYKIIREKNPFLPIIMLSRPDIRKSDDTDKRFAVIEKTYQDARQSGDNQIYLIDGRTIMSDLGEDAGTVDGIHPNDLGFWCMTRKIGEVMQEIGL